MVTIELTTEIAAPIERCFDLSRSIDLHIRSTSKTRESAVAGVTSGLIGMGQQVTWRAKHFGIWHRFTSEITAFDRPRFFHDRMVHGPFKCFDHDHHFSHSNGRTTMNDVVVFGAPLGVLGRIAERLLLTSHLEAFLHERNRIIQEAAESDDWKSFLPP